MIKRLILIGAFVISMVPLFGTNAIAQSFDGWGWFGFSEIEGQIRTIKTPNPQGQPSQIEANVTATIQIACINPATNGVFAGVAFHRPLTDSIPLGAGDISDNGETTTQVLLPLNQFEVSANCPNRRWKPIPESAMALDFSGTVLWCLVKNAGQCTEKELLDSSPVTCSLDMTNPNNQRNSNGTAPHNAVFTCAPPQ
jgi:hypothetical protein